MATLLGYPLTEERIRIIRAMTPMQKLKIAQLLFLTARCMKAVMVRADHPDWTDVQVMQAVKEFILFSSDEEFENFISPRDQWDIGVAYRKMELEKERQRTAQ